jgi:hypothetical protein
MLRLTRSAATIVAVAVLLCVSACGDSSPAPTPSPSELARLTALAEHFGAQQAWWLALPCSAAEDLLGELPGASPSPSATTYVVLMRGDFNDGAGQPMTWEVATGEVGGDIVARVFDARPEVSGHSWTALELP